MADGLNKVMLLGHLGQDPDLKSTGSGQSVLNLRMATSESYKTPEGDRKERTEWHTVIIWGKRADALSKILQKGKQVYVEGRLQTRSWEDKQGQKRYSTEVVANEIILLGGGAGAGERSGGGRGGYGGPKDDEPAPRSSGGGWFADDSDDIPFLFNECEIGRGERVARWMRW